jgi:hypothetical protein
MEPMAFVGQEKEDSGDFRASARDTSLETGAGCLDESSERSVEYANTKNSNRISQE